MAISRLKKNLRDSKSTANNSVSLSLYNSPVYKGTQTRYGNDRWEVYSPKLKRNVTLYSNLEYDHWTLIESNPEIITFCEQPLKISIKLPIGSVTTIFDMWLRWKSGLEEFREIKYENDLEDLQSNSRVSRQIQAQKKWCELNDKKYSIITERFIRSNLIHLSNLKLILRHLVKENHQYQEKITERIIRMVSEQGTSSIGMIQECFTDIESLTVRSAVFELLYRGKLKGDIDAKPLDLNSTVEVANA